MKVFKSGISYKLFVPILLLLGVTGWLSLSENSPVLSVILTSIHLVAITLILNALSQTDYTIVNNKTLNVRCGLLIKFSIDILEINSIQKTSDLSSAPALSFDRIELKYGKSESVILSPRNKKGFIKELTKINPAIER